MPGETIGKLGFIKPTLVSRTSLMTPFVPEIAARARISKEILAQASALHCCMHVHPGAVAISLSDASSGQMVWSEFFEVESGNTESWHDVMAFIQERNWFEKVFRKCTLTFDTSEYTTVPQAFFESGQEQQLLTFQTGRTYENAFSLPLNEFGAQMVFSVPQKINPVSQLFPNVRIFPFAWIFARYCWMQSTASGSGIYLWQSATGLDMMILQNRRLLLLRHDQVQSPEDVLYHLANASMRLGVDLENAVVSLFTLTTNDALHTLLAGYCRGLVVTKEAGVDLITRMQVSCV